ncbi:YwqG family protein [Actinoplanes sp. NPDC020271]|uniref:YwqG family protein n=1 Tax=Actinoplanes sp. NPDC020271 TaxID=3363896 RepID=UPI0037894FE3
MEIDDHLLGAAAPPLRTVLAEAARPSLRLTAAAVCAPDTAATRLGGVPLLAPGATWPESPSGNPQSFLGQLDTDDVNARLGVPVLPPRTLLGFFYDWVEQRWGFDPADAGSWRVTVTPAASALPVSTPDEVEWFTAHAVNATTVCTVPAIDEPPVVAVRAEKHWWQRRDQVEDFYASLENDEGIPVHRVLGWPDLRQGPMQLECQLAANGIHHGNPAGVEGDRVAELTPGAADWLLLWQIDTDDELDWIWGDAGRLYYWIRRQDLAAGAFDRTWLVLQCP